MTKTTGPERTKRIFDRPYITRTRLRKRPGPTCIVAMHRLHGFYAGEIMQIPLWTHQDSSIAKMRIGHPDIARVVAIWANEDDAKDHLSLTLNFDEWLNTTMFETRADLMTSDPDDKLLTGLPIWQCSVEHCCQITGQFKPQPIHLLEDQTTD